jgi:hypothetical protein
MQTRILNTEKDGHKYVFRYPAGCEQEIVDDILRLADGDDSKLDWFDAAILSFQATRQAAQDCRRVLQPFASVPPGEEGTQVPHL